MGFASVSDAAADVDDFASSVGGEVAAGGAGDPGGRLEVDGHAAVVCSLEDFFVRVVEIEGEVDAGVVDDGLEGAVLEDSLDQAAGEAGIAEVGFVDTGGVVSEEGGDGVGVVAAFIEMDGDLPTIGGETEGDGAANAPRGSGHEDPFCRHILYCGTPLDVDGGRHEA